MAPASASTSSGALTRSWRWSARVGATDAPASPTGATRWPRVNGHELSGVPDNRWPLTLDPDPPERPRIRRSRRRCPRPRPRPAAPGSRACAGCRHQPAQQLRAEDRLEACPRQLAVEQAGRALAVRVQASRRQCVGVDDEALQPVARRLAARSRRTSRAALIASRSISSEGTPAKRSLARSLASRPSWMRATLSSSSRSFFSGRRLRSRSSSSLSISTLVVGEAAVQRRRRPRRTVPRGLDLRPRHRD